MNETPETFGFLLLPGFPMAALASAVDVLALSNYEAGKELYRSFMLSIREREVESMNGITSLVDYRIEDAPDFDFIVVCCGIGGARVRTNNGENWLRSRYLKGATIGAVSTGSWVLARAGLLTGKRCTVHWEDLDAFQDSYPDLLVTTEIYESDGRIFTCSGGSAATDLFLSFVEKDHGKSLTSAVADQLVLETVRSNDAHQRMHSKEMLKSSSFKLADAVGLMETHLDEPISIGGLASQLKMSERQLERLCKENLGQTPQLYYRELRLRHARSLLLTTQLSVSQVAFAAGFCTSSYFAKCFQRLYGLPPSKFRNSVRYNHIGDSIATRRNNGENRYKD